MTFNRFLDKIATSTITLSNLEDREDKAAPWAVNSKIALATTATSIADDRLANQLSKW